ncbi:MAG: hypothetical protein V1782_10420 [Pseudomonadota bacterium]
MKKRFASLLLSGKAATLPLLPASSFAGTVSDTIFSSQLHVLEHTADGSVSLLSEFGEAGRDGSYGTTAANVIFPGTGCTGASPTTMNVVVTGLSSQDYVYVLVSRTKDDPFFAQLDPDLRVGSDYQIVTSFGYYSVGADNSTGIVSVPVDLAGINLTAGDTIYLQAAAASVDPQTGSYGAFRFSELDEVIGVAQSCSSYSGTSY